jgi:putative ABC transport system permease protein
MISHIIKLIWNRKKSMALLLIEIFLSFIVAFVVCDLLVSGISNYTKPLGFEYANIWDVRFLSTTGMPFGKLGKENSSKYRMLLNEIKSLPEVDDAAYIIGNFPYGNLSIRGSYEYNGNSIDCGTSYVGDDFSKTMQMTMLEGRWFGPEDDGAVIKPIVINDDLKRAFFGDNSAIGKIIQDPTEKDQDKMGTKYNIIGVVTAYRPTGELSQPECESFQRQQWDDSSYTPLGAMVRIRNGVSGSFELQLQRHLSSLAPDINFRITPLAESRSLKLRDGALVILTPLIIAAFLLFNVILGLFGIFWQSISRRRGEIGLRRALGANSRLIPLQIWGESLAMGTLAILAGIPIIVNLAILGVSKPVGSGIFFLSFICASGIIYLILTICAIYPSLLAVKVQPAEALHNE